MYDSINEGIRGKRSFSGEIAVGKMIVKTCDETDTENFPSYSFAKTNKYCWDDSKDGETKDVKYICDSTTKTLYFGNPGQGFVSNTKIILMEGMESKWTVGNVPGIPIYSRCDASCQVGFCSDHCVAACTSPAQCNKNLTSDFFIVPQDVSEEGNDVTNCGGQGTCCKSYLTTDKYNNVDSYGFVQIKVLLLHSDSDSNVQDVFDKISEFTDFISVKTFDISKDIPTLEYLENFNSVLLWTNFNNQPLDDVKTGNALANYIDGGGGVVSAMCQVASFGQNGIVKGKFFDDDRYQVIQFGQFVSYSYSQKLGKVHLAKSPLMSGVKSFIGGSFQAHRTLGNAVLKSGAERVADWSTGAPLIAYRNNAGESGDKKRVDLGFYPVSKDANDDVGWYPTTDGAQMMRNALLYVAGVSNAQIGSGSEGSGGPVVEGIKVLLLNNDFSRADEIVTKLSTFSDISSVTKFDIYSDVPSLDFFNSFNSILLWVNYDYIPLDAVTTGNALANYIDGGGGVVSAMFQIAEYGAIQDFIVKGKFFNDDRYQVIQFDSYNQGTSSLDKTNIVAHPLTKDVGSFGGGFRPKTSAVLKSGSQVVAKWSTGAPLIAYRNNAGESGDKKRVDLGFYPISTETDNLYGWDQTTDGAIIMRNALMYVAKT